MRCKYDIVTPYTLLDMGFCTRSTSSECSGGQQPSR